MSRRLIMLLFITGAMVSLGMHIFMPVEEPASAKLATVERRDVHQVKAFSGVLEYADEQYVLAPTSGMISKICVQVGQRISADDALVRLDVPTFSQTNMLTNMLLSQISDADHVPQHTVRSQSDYTVRQVLVKEGAVISLGSPLLRLSSSEQNIRCTVLSKDAEEIQPGQWAWIYTNGEKQGTATVISVGFEEVNTMTGFCERTINLAPTQHIDLSEGSLVDIEIFLAGSDHVLALPMEAITDRNTVWWVNKGRCTEIPAEIVLSDEMHAWVNLPEGLLVAIGEFEEGQLVMEADN